MITVKSGTVILQAVPRSISRASTWSDPTAQFFVLRDHEALFGNTITNPRQSTDQAGAPDVTFGFTPRGAYAFQSLTATIAHRAARTKGCGQQDDQHFAMALNTQLIAVVSRR